MNRMAFWFQRFTHPGPLPQGEGELPPDGL